MAEVLSGIRVLEAAYFVSGPSVGQMLADLGADVVKVENPKGGDPFRGPDGFDYGFRAFNPNKRSIAIDLAAPAGADLFRRMASKADILIENFRPGVMERLGIGWDILKEGNDRLIYCSITGFGKDGPYSRRPSYDSVVSALSGFFSQIMPADRPQVLGPAVSDAITGLYAVYGVLGALHQRGQTGRGCRVDVAMIEAMVSFMRQSLVFSFERDDSPDPLERPAASGTFAFQCGDGKLLAIHLSTPVKFWEAFVGVIGRSELLQDPRFLTRADRIKHFRELTELLRPVFRQHSRKDWMNRLEEGDVPFAPINNLKDVEEDPQVRHMGTLTSYTHPTHGEMGAVKRAVRFDGHRPDEVSPPPLLGQHTDQVLAEYGIAAKERAALRGTGTVA